MPELTESIDDLTGGAAALAGLQYALEQLSRLPAKDCDTLVKAYGAIVSEVSLLKPDTLLLTGVDDNGADVVVLVHYTQLIAHIVFLPMKGEVPIVTTIKPSIRLSER